MGKIPTEVKIKIGMNPYLDRDKQRQRQKTKTKNKRAFKFIDYIIRHSNNHKVLVLPFF